eukprot:CAMPEP_0206174372 /NCGR_PEP_ID=MMETSP1474-20131121/51857_1 /ASSEMBLY_ACC=CAM_ASM_001110 /TAXON_ID=97495 /ORGANISM="Imantonia sp., Strain RCC918" /LENGTH=164 /DNA_ID=CAMNT_0053583845 /DNA_START=28 /DNA_END=519 /DNA_ORIENTATION=+
MAQVEETLVVESPPAPSPRVEGWVQYYEYFHRLNEDMQRTSEAGAQRRSSASSQPLAPPFLKRDTTCFDAIVASMKLHDKPLVHIEDAADGSAMLSTDKVSAVPGGRTLTDSDLALVRAQLRAAAQASNMRAAAAAEEDTAMAAAAAAEEAKATAGAKASGGVA